MSLRFHWLPADWCGWYGPAIIFTITQYLPSDDITIAMISHCLMTHYIAIIITSIITSSISISRLPLLPITNIDYHLPPLRCYATPLPADIIFAIILTLSPELPLRRLMPQILPLFRHDAAVRLSFTLYSYAMSHYAATMLMLLLRQLRSHYFAIRWDASRFHTYAIEYIWDDMNMSHCLSFPHIRQAATYADTLPLDAIELLIGIRLITRHATRARAAFDADAIDYATTLRHISRAIDAAAAISHIGMHTLRYHCHRY